MSKIKVGVIGVGSIATQHIASYLKNPDVELYALCDINPERLKLMGEKYGVTRLYTDKDEMLKLKEIDAVSVCTWNSEHAPCTIAALNAGKHVLCEKPMATNTEDAIAMKEAAQKNGKLLMIGFVRRFGNDCDVLRDINSDGFLGDIYYAKAAYMRRNGNPGGWFGDMSRSGGGPLIDLGVHIIDFVGFVMGNPKPVSVYGVTFNKLGNRPGIKTSKAYTSSGASNNDTCDVEDLATALIRYDNGAVLSVETSFSLNTQKKEAGKIEFFGTKGGAKLEPELELYTELNGYMADVSLVAPTKFDFAEAFQKEINHYVECVINGSTVCRNTADDGIALMRILDAVYESANTGHEVVIN